MVKRQLEHLFFKASIRQIEVELSTKTKPVLRHT
jgi:hypothetical protein